MVIDDEQPHSTVRILPTSVRPRIGANHKWRRLRIFRNGGLAILPSRPHTAIPVANLPDTQDGDQDQGYKETGPPPHPSTSRPDRRLGQPTRIYPNEHTPR